ncbi:MAG: ROK family protein [Candidatus Enterenecus sp.]
MEEKGANQQLLRQKNNNLIKKYIFQHSPVSRVEVAEALGLTTPTITGMVTPLLSRGLLREVSGARDAEKARSAGRPRIMLEYVPDTYYVCGVDVSPYHINYVLTDLCGNIVRRRRTGESLKDYDSTFGILADGIAGFLTACGTPREKLLGVGMCMPGLIDGSAGKIYTNFQNGWNDHDLSGELGEKLGVPVVIENNVRARAIGADLFDRSAAAEPFAYFFVSYGVACQMIISDRVLYGQSAAAGEIGHTVVQRGGPVCPTCGNRGCLEALAGERAVLQRCRDAMAAGEPTVLGELCPDPEALTVDHVLRAQDMGDPVAGAIIEDVIDYLGIALANTINLISPRTVVLDGRMLDTPKNRDLILRAIKRNIFLVHMSRIQFTILPYEPDRGARGAAAVVVRERLLNNPLV